MKNIIRKWLGINDDMQAIAKDMNGLGQMLNQHGLNTYELFHALPFAAGIISMTSNDAARITQPQGIQQNSLPAILTGVALKARQGDSYLEVQGELDQPVRDHLVARGFKVEDSEGTGGKFTHILWL